MNARQPFIALAVSVKEGLGSLQVPLRPARHDMMKSNAPAFDPGAEQTRLLNAPTGKLIVIGRTERSLAMADQVKNAHIVFPSKICSAIYTRRDFMIWQNPTVCALPDMLGLFRRKITGLEIMARIIALIAALSLLLPLSARAQAETVGKMTDADISAIRQVIKAQLSALQHDDGVLAFSYATPMIQRQFGTPANFLSMVKTAYPPVYRPRAMQFRELEATYDGPVQKVFFIGPAGQTVLGLYSMQKQRDGSWKVNGCALTAAPDISI